MPSTASTRLTPSEIESLRKDAKQASAEMPAALAKARAEKAARELGKDEPAAHVIGPRQPADEPTGAD
jgi:hypothetical protein